MTAQGSDWKPDVVLGPDIACWVPEWPGTFRVQQGSRKWVETWEFIPRLERIERVRLEVVE